MPPPSAVPRRDHRIDVLRGLALLMIFVDHIPANVLSLFDILALAYLLFSSDLVRTISASPLLRPLDVCGRHSLEVFSIGCVAALFGRLIFRTYGPSPLAQVAVNAIGFAAMWLVAIYLDHRQAKRRREAEAVRPAEGARRA